MGFRNILIHGYIHVDHAIVWRTATDGAAELASAIASLLDAEA